MTDHLLGHDTDDTSSAGDARADDHDNEPTDANSSVDAAVGDETAGEEITGHGATPSAWSRWRERRRNRISKWDRPPDPKDWRYFVGTLGKVLIATGILMFGFVAYQLWGTGIEHARAQNALENTFEAAVAANQTADAAEPDDSDGAVDTDSAAEPDTPVATVPVDDSTAVDDTDTDTDTDGESGATTGDDLEQSTGVGGSAPSEVVPGGVDLSGEAVVQNVPIVPEGDPIAKMEIPRIGVEEYVVQGVTLDDLKTGPGHYPDTPLPGQLGNASIAGHRTTYGAPFFDVDQLQPGDEIIVTMVTGDRFVYAVTGSQVVTAADSWVIGTRDPNVAELTLTTCHPKYTARDRLVIHSVLVPEQSARVGQAEFWDAGTREVAVEADERPTGDDPTFDTGRDTGDDGDDGATGAKSLDDEQTAVPDPDADADDRTDAVFLDPTSDPSDDPSDDADEPATDDASGRAIDDQANDDQAIDDSVEDAAVADPADAEIDAFSEGWFDDDEAWPQIALWGSVLTLISLLAYQLSKKTRHDSVGFMVGIFPFLVALYFFFQNVNRLLPPGL